MVENLPANAGHTGSSPGLGRSHMPQINWAREPQLLSLRVWSLCSATREATILRGPRTAVKSGPHLPQLEKVLAQKRRPNTAIKKQKKQKNPSKVKSALGSSVTFLRLKILGDKKNLRRCFRAKLLFSLKNRSMYSVVFPFTVASGIVLTDCRNYNF